MAESNFDDWTYEDARSTVAEKQPGDAEVNKAFFSGDHWQDGDGWSLYMPPGLPLDNVLNDGMGHPKLSGKGALADTASGKAPSDFRDYRRCELRQPVSFASGDSLWLRMSAIPFASGSPFGVSVRSAPQSSSQFLRVQPRPAVVSLRCASFDFHIKVILGVRAQKEMVWANAKAIVAAVANKQIARIGLVCQQIRDAMSAIALIALNRYAPIASGAKFTAPFPTTVIGKFGNFLPKSNLLLFGENRQPIINQSHDKNLDNRFALWSGLSTGTSLAQAISILA